ncbi:MAG: GNAT family N-acetyltransferase [Clostridia bacterium]|nr:GNAT family N-acetyltransferase [Clostridia bacterium]
MDFILTGAEIAEDTPEYLILRKGLIHYGLGRADLSETFRKSLMALCMDEEASKIMADDGCFDGVMPCWQYVFPENHIELPHPEGFDVRPLTLDDVPFLVREYHHPSATPRQMTERVEEGMLGVCHEGNLVGFVGTHAEGSIGLLEVLPDYRRKGLAKYLMSAMVDDLLKKGRIPYAHVKLGNEASMRLQEHIGMVRAATHVTWLCKNEEYRKANLI